MLEKMLEKCFDEESAADNRADNVKTAVLSRIKVEEDKPMKKHFRIKPLLIAAAITATGAASLITANAATDGAISDYFANTFSFIVGGKEYSGTVTTYKDVDGNVTNVDVDVPDGVDADAVGVVITREGDGDPEVTVVPITDEDDGISDRCVIS